MRISTTQFYQSGTNAINRQQAQLLDVYSQISSGRRMVNPSDDPLGAAQAINVGQARSLNARLADNRNVAKQNLGLEENALTAATQLMEDIKTRLVEASNGTLSDADRQTLAQVVLNLRDNMVGIANTTDGNGQYLFSGHQGDRAPFAQNGEAVTWQGDQGKRMVQVDQARQISVGDDGMEIFLRATPGDRTYTTGAAASNTGTGIISDPVVTDPAGANVGRDFSISFSGTPAEYTVTVTDKAGVAIGAPVGPTPFDAQTGVVELPGGMQVNLKGAPVEGDAFSVRSMRGEENSVFDTLTKLANALNAPTQGDPAAGAALRNTLTESMQKLDSNYNAILSVRASLGSRMQELDALDASGSQRGLGFNSELSRLQDLDLYTATMNIQMRQAGLEAASLAFQKIQSLTMFSIRR